MLLGTYMNPVNLLGRLQRLKFYFFYEISSKIKPDEIRLNRYRALIGMCAIDALTLLNICMTIYNILNKEFDPSAMLLLTTSIFLVFLNLAILGKTFDSPDSQSYSGFGRSSADRWVVVIMGLFQIPWLLLNRYFHLR